MRTNRGTPTIAGFGLLVSLLLPAAGQDPAVGVPAAGLIRIESGVSGHIHPAACVTEKGTVVVIYSKSDFKDLQIVRSTDGGKSWSKPIPFGPTKDLSIYPGSLTALRDGRIVHAWNTWYKQEDAKGGKSRFIQFSISSDDGKTWSEPTSLLKNPKAESIVRHSMVELALGRWLFAASDATFAFDPKTNMILTPFGDARNHGLTPIVRTPKGTFVTGTGLRSTDVDKNWESIKPFPDIKENGWRFDLVALDNGWLIASEVQGAGVGGDRWRFVVSKDDGKTWDFEKAHMFYDPGRPIGGRACPKTVQLDKETLGTVFYDVDGKQAGGPGVFFLRTPLKKL
jgi:hypothetical protein